MCVVTQCWSRPRAQLATAGNKQAQRKESVVLPLNKGEPLTANRIKKEEGLRESEDGVRDSSDCVELEMLR